MTWRALYALLVMLACPACGKEEVVCHGSHCVEQCGAEGCPSAAGVIHRSVGPDSTTALALGDENPMRIEGSVAAFDQPLPDRIGVGDALVSTFGEASSIAFITSRRSSTAYELQTADGGSVPDNVAPTNHWSVYRAYTSLADAADRLPNPGIPAALAGFDDSADATVDRKDLVATEKIWSIACYGDAIDSSADTRHAYFQYWTTSRDYYLRIYTPSSAAEVGKSQRHDGVLDPSRYQLRKTANCDDGWIGMLRLAAQFARVEGLQIVDTASDSADWMLVVAVLGEGEVQVGGNLFVGNPSNLQDTYGVILSAEHMAVASSLVVYNNVLSGMSRAGVAMNIGDSPNVVARMYNNTFYDCEYGIETGPGRQVAVNNLFGAMWSNCVSQVTAIDASSDYNICSTTEPVTGTHSFSGTSATWVDRAAGNFHLSPEDTAATGKGADLSSDPYFQFQIDFDGEVRSGNWDVGADQR